MLGLGSDGEGAPLVLLHRANTVDLDRAVATLGGGELDFDDLILPVVDSRSPTDTVLSDGGQMACWCSQSMRNPLSSMPCAVVACHFTLPRAGPITSIPY